MLSILHRFENLRQTRGGSVRAMTGEWFAVHAAPLAGCDGTHQIAITIEGASPSALLPLVASTLGLTTRESEVTAAVLRGDPTSLIAKCLHMSPYTVQDHLKSIFAKAGVSSRRELMSWVFFEHYAPRKGAQVGVDGWFVADDVAAIDAGQPAR